MTHPADGDSRLPCAVLLDLDDTIIDDSRHVSSCWREACLAHGALLAGTDPALVYEEIERVRAWYWADAERHRLGRLRLADARRDVVAMALSNLELGRADLAKAIAGHYQAARERGLVPIEGAVETVHWLRERGCRLALLTNGDGRAQRLKIDRYQLGPLFEHILIEGEMGFGKPDRRVYELALESLGLRPHETWMVGDNLEWDVAAPQALGISGIWIDAHGRGLPSGFSPPPARILRSLPDLMRSG